MSQIFFVGNALVDFAVKCDLSLLKKYGLEVDMQTLCSPSQVPLFEEVSKMENVSQVPGGSAQNSARIVAAIAKKEEQLKAKSCIAACIGDDEFGKFLINTMTNCGVLPLYQVSSKNPTGTTACLLTSDSERTIVANIAASTDLTCEWFETPQVAPVLQSASMIYAEGYVMTDCAPVVAQMAAYSAANGKCFGLGISAVFVAQICGKNIMNLMNSCDMLFGNLAEATELVKHVDTSDKLTPEDIAKKLVTSQPKSYDIAGLPGIKRIVIVTQGPDPIILAKLLSDNSTVIEKFDVPPVNITGDGIGAGDAFVAGYLISLLNKCSMEEAVTRGTKYAAQCLQHTGCWID